LFSSIKERAIQPALFIFMLGGTGIALQDKKTAPASNSSKRSQRGVVDAKQSSVQAELFGMVTEISTQS
jgi:hypothetical protein